MCFKQVVTIHSLCMPSLLLDISNSLHCSRYNSGNVVGKAKRCQTLSLKELRKQRNITQLKLAIDLNMNQNTISRYETGEREAGYRELIIIADYFDVSIDYLLGRSNNPKFLK